MSADRSHGADGRRTMARLPQDRRVRRERSSERAHFVISGFLNGDESAVQAMLADPYVIVGGSDGGAHVKFICQVSYSSQLLGYEVREGGVRPVETAVRRLTFEPAMLLGLRDRGLIREGWAADLVLI